MKTRFDELAEDLPTDNTKIPWYPGCEGCFFAADDGQNTGYKNQFAQYTVPSMANLMNWLIVVLVNTI